MARDGRYATLFRLQADRFVDQEPEVSEPEVRKVVA
jgi:hypothetical protein